MDPSLVVLVVLGYFMVLLFVSYLTSKGANNQSFFIGNRKSPWYLVAIGMVGTSLSGVTFISVPGWVCASQFTYIQMVIGYLLGYLVIAFVLLPVYYKLNLTTIYTYLNIRLGNVSYKTGASLFLISRLVGASFRLFLVANVLQVIVFDPLKVPFAVTVLVTLVLIWIYTFRGGIKTIVWTDTLQTIFMVLAVILTFLLLSREMGLSVPKAIDLIKDSDYGFAFDFSSWKSGTYFWKHFLSGAFITIVMTGLDQDMMQKNLSCKNLKDAQKNMLVYSLAFVPVNLIFMGMGALLYIFAARNGIPFPERTDNIFPLIATNGYLPIIVGILFILGLIAAAYSSADSALTALTTSFLVDILGVKNNKEDEIKRKRIAVHIAMSFIMALIIILFYAFSNESVIESLFNAASYTYGPLLGLFAFGLFTQRRLNKWIAPVISVIAPVAIYLLNVHSKAWLNGYQMGFEKLIYNGLLTFIVLWVFSRKGITGTGSEDKGTIME